MSEKPTLKQILPQLQFWCAVNNVSVQSVYDECHGMTLQDIVYYLFGVVKQASEEVVDYEGQFEELYNYVHDYFDNLDVQDEINNKLDEMAKDGTLNSLINKIVSDTLPPLVVDSVGEMTNTLRTYILKSNSHVYQYINSNWVDTGITFGGDMGNIFTYIGEIGANTDLNELDSFGMYIYEPHVENVQNKPPFDNTDPSFYLFTYKTFDLHNYTVKMQVAYEYNTSKVMSRQMTSENVWGGWYYSGDDLSKYLSVTDFTLANGYDFNNLESNKIYCFLSNRNYTNAPALNGGFVITMQISILKMQIAFEFDNNNIALRGYYKEWTSWTYTSKPRYYTMAVIGDSISDYTGFNDNKTEHSAYYPALGVTEFIYMWHSRVSASMKNNFSYIDALTGSCIANNNDKSFVNRVKNIPCTDLIIIEGGTNDKMLNIEMGDYIYEDWSDEDLKKFRPALAYILWYLTQRYQNSKIVFFKSNYIDGEYEESITTICDHYNVQIIDFGWEYETSVHPTNTNMIIMSNQIINGLK